MKVTARIGTWSSRAFGALLAVVALYVATVTYPTPLFGYHQRFGDYRVYSDQPIPPDFARVVEDTARRLGAMQPRSDRHPPRVYLCESRWRYELFALLLRKGPATLGIGLTLANEVFVSMTRVREFAAENRGRLRHTRFEGDAAEVIAHEVAHFNSVRALGYRRHLAQPLWKSEGWAEYQANLASLRDDPAYDLRERIAVWRDDRAWADRPAVARDQWAWQLLVEFLGEVKGYRLGDLVRDDVTWRRTMDQMLDWYRGDRPPRG